MMEQMKNNIRKDFLFIAIIFILILGFRLFFTLQDPNFSDGSAYTNIRNVNNVLESYKPITYDELSYSGKNVVNPPLFFYLMAILTFGNVFLLKIIPEIFLALSAVIIYIIAKEITSDENSSLAAAIISGFIPIFLVETNNRISILSFVIPMLLLMFYCSLKLEEKFYLWCFIVLSFLLPLISPWSLIFVLGMFAYLFLLGGGFLTASKIKKEAILFSSFLIILINLIIYKKALLAYGVSLIWQNTPANILFDSFRSFNPIELIIGLGILPLVLGGYGIYLGIAKYKTKATYLFGGFILSVLVLLVFRLITLMTGLLFLGITLSIFSALGIKDMFQFISKTKISKLFWGFALVLIVLLVLFSVIPSYSSLKLNKINSVLVNDMSWADDNLDRNAVVLGNIYEGEFISGIANRKNVADINFLLAPKPVERLDDIGFIYSTWSEAKSLELLKKYNINAIYFSEQTKFLYNIKELKYAENKNCFEREGDFYAVKC